MMGETKIEVMLCDVMFHARGRKNPTAVHKRVPVAQAMRMLAIQERSWQASKPGRYAQRMGLEVILRFSDGKIAGSAWLETHPVRESSPNKSA